MTSKTYVVLNLVLAALVVVGGPTFGAMPPVVATLWTVTTIALGFLVVFHGFRRFFASKTDDTTAR